MPWVEISLRAALLLVVLSASVWAYVWVLLQIGKVSRLAIRIVLASVAYLAIATLFAGGLIYLLRVPAPQELRDRWWFTAVIIAVYACVIAPGIRYLRSRLPELRAAGY